MLIFEICACLNETLYESCLSLGLGLAPAEWAYPKVQRQRLLQGEQETTAQCDQIMNLYP
jgi:hypothetical protein